jgi:hypothetical protein
MISWLPLLLLIAAVAMLLFTVLAWLSLFTGRRADWGLAGRLHYTLLTALAVAVVASLWYWNLLA